MNVPQNVEGRARPIDLGFGFVNLGGVCGALFILFGQLQRASRQRRHRPAHQVGAQPRQPVVHILRGHGVGDGQPLGHRHWACVEALGHLHHHDAGFSIAFHHGPIDWRSAPPTRQQRGMQIVTTMLRRFQNGFRQNHAIGDDHRCISTKPGEAGFLVVAFQTARMKHRNAQPIGLFVHRRAAQLHATSGGRGGTGVASDDLVAVTNQFQQCWNGKIRRSHKDKFQHGRGVA